MIPLVDLKAQYEAHRDALEGALRAVCESTAFILGPPVAAFERRFAAYCGVREAIGVGSGTDALRFACMAAGIQPGDEVLVPANTFVATAVAVTELGAVPVLVDADPDTCLMDLADAARHMTGRTRAVLPVHLYGRVLDLDALEAFARRNDLFVIEDACQSHGARWDGRVAGACGAAGCFSFYPAKNLGGFGDGGMVITDNPDLAERVRLLRNYGSVRKYEHELAAGNSRLDSIHAAVLDVKLDFLDGWNARRRAIAARYIAGLAGAPGLRVPSLDAARPESHVFHLFVVRHARRDALAAYLAEHGVQTGIHYPVPIHLHHAFAALGHGPGDFPVSEQLSREILSLPMYPEMSDAMVDTVIEAVSAFCAQ